MAQPEVDENPLRRRNRPGPDESWRVSNASITKPDGESLVDRSLNGPSLQAELRLFRLQSFGRAPAGRGVGFDSNPHIHRYNSTRFLDAVRRRSVTRDGSFYRAPRVRDTSEPVATAPARPGADGDEGIEEEIRAAFAAIDVDGTGGIDADEIRDALVQLGDDPTPDDVMHLMHLVDENGDGELSYDEFRTLYFKYQTEPDVAHIDVKKMFTMSSLLKNSPEQKAESDRIYNEMPLLERVAAAFLKFMITRRQRKRELKMRKLSKKWSMLVSSATAKAKVDEQVADGHWPPTVPLPHDDGDTEWPPLLLHSAGGEASLPHSDSLLSPRSPVHFPAFPSARRTSRFITSFFDETQQSEHDIVDVNGMQYKTISVATAKKVRLRAWLTVLRACIIGAVSGGMSGIIELLLTYRFTNGNGTDVPWNDGRPIQSRILYWSLFAFGIVICTIIEVFMLYTDALWEALKSCELCGVRLYPLDEQRANLTRALSRVTLEINHPSDYMYGIDPMKRHSKWRKILRLFVYKAKSGVIVFLIRLAIKRGINRAVAKAYLSFVTIPINCVWNGLVSYKVTTKTLPIIVGPPTLLALVDSLLVGKAFPYRVRLQLFRCVGVAVSRNGAFHPNLEMIANHLDLRMGKMRAGEILDDMPSLLAALGEADYSEQVLILKMLLINFMADGAMQPRDRYLYNKAVESAGMRVAMDDIVDFTEDFASGNAHLVTPARMDQLVERPRNTEDRWEAFLFKFKSVVKSIWRFLLWILTY